MSDSLSDVVAARFQNIPRQPVYEKKSIPLVTCGHCGSQVNPEQGCARCADAMRDALTNLLRWAEANGVPDEYRVPARVALKGGE